MIDYNVTITICEHCRKIISRCKCEQPKPKDVKKYITKGKE